MPRKTEPAFTRLDDTGKRGGAASLYEARLEIERGRVIVETP
jgi:hypothetical protein